MGAGRLAPAPGAAFPSLTFRAGPELQAEKHKLTGEIYTLQSAGVYGGVSSGENDFGVCFSPQSHASIGIQPLHEGQLRIAVRKGHPALRVKDEDRLARPRDDRSLVRRSKSFQGIDNGETHPVFARHGISPKIDLIFDSYLIAVEKVNASDGWTFLPDRVIRKSGLVAITTETWSAPVTIAAIWPANRIQTRVTRSLVAAMKRRLD